MIHPFPWLVEVDQLEAGLIPTDRLEWEADEYRMFSDLCEEERIQFCR